MPWFHFVNVSRSLQRPQCILKTSSNVSHSEHRLTLIPSSAYTDISTPVLTIMPLHPKLLIDQYYGREPRSQRPNPFKKPTSSKPVQKRYIKGALQGLEVLESFKPPSTSEKALVGATGATNAATESKRDIDVHPLILEGRIRQRLKRPERVSNGRPPTSLSQIWTYFLIKDGTGNVTCHRQGQCTTVADKTSVSITSKRKTIRCQREDRSRGGSAPCHSQTHSEGSSPHQPSE